MPWQVVWYGVAIALVIYIAYNLVKTKKFTIDQALALLAIVMSIIFVQNPAPNAQFRNQYQSADTVSAFVIPLLETIEGAENELTDEIPWWNFTVWGNQSGRYDPAGCFGIAWNAVGYTNTVIVFTQARELAFAPDPAGWSGRLCIQGTTLSVTARDVGEIQRRWLSQKHGGRWQVMVLD